MRGEGGVDRGHHAEHEDEAKTTENGGEKEREVRTLVTSFEPLNFLSFFFLSH